MKRRWSIRHEAVVVFIRVNIKQKYEPPITTASLWDGVPCHWDMLHENSWHQYDWSRCQYEERIHPQCQTHILRDGLQDDPERQLVLTTTCVWLMTFKMYSISPKDGVAEVKYQIALFLIPGAVSAGTLFAYDFFFSKSKDKMQCFYDVCLLGASHIAINYISDQINYDNLANGFFEECRRSAVNGLSSINRHIPQ